MRRVVLLLLVLSAFVIAAPRKRRRRSVQIGNDGMSSDQNFQSATPFETFQSAWEKRRKLDERGHYRSPEDAELISDFESHRAQARGDPASAHEEVRRYCRHHKEGGCSYQQAYVLLVHDMKEREVSVDRPFSQRWQEPSDILRRAYPARGQTTCDTIHKVPTAKEFLDNYVSKGVPVIIRGGASSWPAVRQRPWTMGYLVDRVGGETVKVYTSPNRDFEAPTTMGVYRSWLPGVVAEGEDHREEDAFIADHEAVVMRPAETEFTFREYAFLTQNYSNRERAVFYLQKHALGKWRHTGVLDDLLPSLFEDPPRASGPGPRRRGGQAGAGWARFLALEHWLLWMGKGFTRGNMHYDANENLHALLRGSKTFELFHPFNKGMYEDLGAQYRSAHFLYSWQQDGGGRFWSLPVSATKQGYQPFSPVNTTHPDPIKHPLYNAKEKLTCKVNAGDLIYIPSNWWHEVLSDGDEEDGIFIGINMFFHPWWVKSNAINMVSRNELYSHLWDVGDVGGEEDAVESSSRKRRRRDVLGADYWR